MRKKGIRDPRVATGRIFLFLLASIFALPASGHGQAASYLDFDGLTGALRSLADGSDLVGMRSVGSSIEGREIWLVEIGNSSGAPLGERPAVLVVGNLEGDHLVGSSLALEMIRYLVDHADDPDVRAVLDEQTVYVFPRVNPDGAEARFGSILRERTRNARPYDDDNDGRIDEDGPEDLNGDRLITVMRVRDPSGEYMIDPDEPRLMKKADAAKGEKAEYALYWEGTDTDGDGFLNEDGPGGVDLNRNFQHEYPYYTRDAGPHMVSEPESRALMEFVVAHRNIGAILVFGLTDDLVTPPDSRGELAGPSVLDLPAFADASNAGVFEVGVFGGRPTGGFGGFGGFPFGGRGSGFRGAQPGRDNDPDSGRRPATTVNEADREYFETVSEAYRSITGIERVGIHRKAEGAFFQYGYFQFGVPSFSTPGWGLPASRSDEEGDEGEEAGEEGDEGDEEGGGQGAGHRPQVVRVVAAGERGGPPGGRGRGGPSRGGGPQGAAAGGAGGGGIDAKLLAAMDSIGIDAFVQWSTYAHPSLDEVEIGGFQPYATTNPPAEDLPELGRKHGEFLVRLAGMLPRVRIVETEVTAHGGGVFTVEVEVENSGYFPTSTRHGVVSRSVQPTIVQIQVPPEDLITGDAKTSRLQRLDGSGHRESFLWVIRGRPGAEVEIRVLAQKGGTDTATVTLR